MTKGQRRARKSGGLADALPQLLELPLFTGLDDELGALLNDRITMEEFPAGAPIIHQDSEASDVIFLLHGEVAVTRDSKLVTLIQPPEALGVISVLDGHRRTATLNAFTPARVARISTPDFRDLLHESDRLKDNLLRSMAAKLRGQYGLSDQVQRHFDDFFKSPHAELVPGPYVADPFAMYVFVMEGEPKRVADLLPRGLKGLPGAQGRYLLTFNFFEAVTSLAPESDGRSFAYHETASFVPCLGPRFRPGLFVPELYPDNFLAITLGRELYGFPKRFARTTLNASSRSIDLVLARQVVLRAGWSEETTIDFETFLDTVFDDLWPTWVPDRAKSASAGALAWVNDRVSGASPITVPVFVHKHIPNSDGTPCIDQLKAIPFQVDALSDFTRLEASTVRFFDESHFLHGKCRGAFRLRLGLRFAEDEVLKDYRPQKNRMWRRPW